MRRREVIVGLGTAAAWPLAVTRAAGGSDAPDRRADGICRELCRKRQANVAAFRDGTPEVGWTEGRNIRIDTRCANPDDAVSMQRFAKELVAL